MNQQIGLKKICWLFGVSRQAYYQGLNRKEKEVFSNEILLQRVEEIRKLHPKMGTRKLYFKLKNFIEENNIKIGRDAFFALLYEHNLLIRKSKRSIRTTYSNHWMRKYPNLIKEYVPQKANQLYVSDITYWKIETGFIYLSLITDVYSHKIVGYYLSDTLEAKGTVKALEMAIKENNVDENTTHHSDRGSQYCCADYISLLNKNNCKISMTENGDPRENALAERINGIIKNEYLHNYQLYNLEEAKELLNNVVKLYNEDRPHLSIGNLTPEEVHSNENLKFKKLWKSYY
jgi:putative transposase